MQAKHKRRYYIHLVVLLLLCLGPATALSQKTQKEPDMVWKNIPLKKALKLWEEKTGNSVYYNENILPAKHQVSGDFNGKTASESLEMILQGTGLIYTLQGESYILKKRDAEPPVKSSPSAKGQKVTGYVRDADSGENLIGASVYIPGSDIGTTTNTFGYFSLDLPVPDSVQLRISYTGYVSQLLTLQGIQHHTADIALSAQRLKQVTISTGREYKISEGARMSSITLSQADIEKVPMLMGEADLLRVIQLMPGVQSGGEGSTGFYVRGGGPDQNLILLDGVPVYNASHLFGFFSVFNTDAISRAELIKGGFPARFGGRLSSVLDITMKEGNMHKYTGEGSVGPLSARFLFEGPIVKNKASFMISARRTFMDLFLLPWNLSRKSATGFSYYFYDINGKLNWKINDKHHIYLSAYTGEDNLSLRFRDGSKANNNFYESKSKLGWNNITSALRWNYAVTPSLFMNTTLTYTRFRFKTASDLESLYANESTRIGFSYRSGIDDLAAATDFDWFASPRHHVKFGARYIFHYFSPGITSQYVNGVSSQNNTGRLTAGETQIYIEDEWKAHSRFSMNIGIHGSTFHVQKKNYWSLQPRVTASFKIIENLALKASYAEMAQYIHLLSNPGLNLPTDIWLPSTGQIKPQQSRQVALGIFKDWGNILQTSVEGYYKTMNNVLEYRNGSSFLLTGQNWEQSLTQGKGESYGAELFVRKRTGKITGWAGYTLSWTNRRFADLNGGKTFPYKYDRRHDFKMTLSYAVTPRIDIGATWVYGTGNAITLPVETVPMANPGNDDDIVHNYEERNGFRMKANHRLDLSLSFHKKTRWGQRTWNISIYNVYNRQNPFFYYASAGKLNQVSISPVIPSFSYIFKFR